MRSELSRSESNVWRLDAARAMLRMPQFSAEIELLVPGGGLRDIHYSDDSPSGHVLGAAPGAGEPMSMEDVDDAFVRGSDMVVNYAETSQRPFSLQIYWRARADDHGVVLLDTILSLQTDLLESFPDVAIQTKLRAATAWQLSEGESGAREIALQEGSADNSHADLADGVLLRSIDHKWSYAETTHHEDRGENQIGRDDEWIWVSRLLGGRFLEKGVIRRLRVRGAFLPRENDLELATQYLAGLASEQPPLTV